MEWSPRLDECHNNTRNIYSQVKVCTLMFKFSNSLCITSHHNVYCYKIDMERKEAHNDELQYE